jgi:hypothetical protein
MSDVDEVQAREHIAMVDRILAQSQPRLCTGGEFFIVWGIGSAAVTTLFACIDLGMLPSVAAWWAPVILLACAIYSFVRARAARRTLASSSLLQREFFNVLWISVGLAFIADAAAFRLFPGIASAAIWSVVEAIVLLYIGMHGNRRALLCGVLVVVSLIVANFIGGFYPPFVLAAGMFLGYAGFGLSELLVRE